MLRSIASAINLRRARSEERGVVLVIVAVSLVAILAFAAIAIDIGSFYQAQRQAQAAADAGALAGADDLNSNPSGVTTDATNYAKTNFPGATPTVSEPTSTSVKVTVSAVTPSFFGAMLGLTSQNVKASATAASSGYPPCTLAGNTCYAIFAMDQSCSNNGFTGGGGIHITGGVHSNGSMNVGGGGSSFGATTYGSTSGCSVSPSGYSQQSNTFTSGPLAQAPILSWPIDYATLDFPACSGSACTGPCDNGASSCTSTYKTPSFCTEASNSASTWELDSYYPYTLLSGQIYCDVGTGNPNTPSTWNGTLLANQSGSTTIESSYVAGTVKIGGGSKLEACGYSLSGYQASACNSTVPAPGAVNYPLAYATQTGTSIDASSGGGTLTGDLFAPNGTINIGGGSSTSFLEAQDVNWSSGGITGDGPNMSGSGSSTGGSSSLIQ